LHCAHIEEEENEIEEIISPNSYSMSIKKFVRVKLETKLMTIAQKMRRRQGQRK
jgi:hypothetical protein